jgi:hypothetical protein
MDDPTVVVVARRPRGLVRVSQVIDYLFWLLYALLFIRLILVFFEANGVGFVRFIDGVTNPFYSPFRGIVSSPTVQGGYILAIPILVAMVVYGLLHLAINKLLWMVADRFD